MLLALFPQTLVGSSNVRATVDLGENQDDEDEKRAWTKSRWRVGRSPDLLAFYVSKLYGFYVVQNCTLLS